MSEMNVACAGNRIREYRQSMGISQTKLGDTVGVTRQTIGLLEAGKFNPSLKIISKLIVATSSSFEDLFPGYINVEVHG